MIRLRSAVKQGQRPTAALLCDPNPHGNWTKKDYLLQDAFFVMNNEICTICNNPVWLCHSTDNRIEFEAKVRTCYAKAVLEETEQGKNGLSKFEAGPGEYLIAVPVGIETFKGEYDPLPTRQEAYAKMPTDKD